MTKIQFRILYREFLFRMVDLDVLSSSAQGDMSKLFGQFAALLVFLGIGFCIPAMNFGGRGLPMLMLGWSMEHVLISTTMLIVGLFAVLSWDSTFPNKRDVMVLAPLPVRARTLFGAKVAAVASALAITVGAFHMLAGLVWPVTLNSTVPAQIVPSFTFQPAIAPVRPAAMPAVLGADLGQTPCRGAIGVWSRGESQVFACGAADADAIGPLGPLQETLPGLVLAVMAEEGQVAFDQPVRLLLPEGVVRKPIGAEILLVDLATNRSGLPRMAPPYDLDEYIARRGVGRLPQTFYQPSAVGFALLQEVLARRAGVSWDELLRQKVTGPLGMRDTTSSGTTAGDVLKFLKANLHPENLGAAMRKAIGRSHVTGQAAGLGWHYQAGTWSAGPAYFNTSGDFAAVTLVQQAPDALGEHLAQRLSGKPAVSFSTMTIPAGGGFLRMLRLFGVYWFTMLAAGAFIFCCVLGAQGVAAQLLPRRLFLRVSSILQLVAFCLFVTVYFGQPGFVSPARIAEAQGGGLLGWSPSYWFLGLFQQLSGSPAMAALARRAWIGLAVAVSVTAVAYLLSYLRTLRKIVEEPDIVPGAKGIHWLPRFGALLPTAIVQFSIRTLLRSRQHRMLLMFYLGTGFALAIFFLKTDDGQTVDPWRQVSMPLLVSTVTMLCLSVLGTRVVMAMPLDLRANWIFRIAPMPAGAACRSARRRAFWALGVAPLWTVFAVLLFYFWPWRAAAGHLLLLALLGVGLSELCLRGTQKLPFTCSYLPGKSNFHLSFWLYIVLMVQVLVRSALFELEALSDPVKYAAAAASLAVAALAIHIWNRSEDDELQFEEASTPAIYALEIHKDGVVPL